MEEKNHVGGCACSRSCDMGAKCGYGFACHHKFFFIRWFLAIVIIVMVFSLGAEFGELRANFGSSYGNYGGFRQHMYRYRTMMSPDIEYFTVSTAPSSAAVSAPATKIK